MNGGETSTIALYISGFSLIVSLIGFIVSFGTYQRDKPKLKMAVDYSSSIYEPPTMRVTVSNVGYRPTTVTDAGYLVDQKIEFTAVEGPGKKEGPKSFGSVNISLVDQPVVIPPGETRIFQKSFPSWPSPFLHADFPLRPYVFQLNGKKLYGGAGTTMRDLVGGMAFKPDNIPKGALDEFKGILRPVYEENLRQVLMKKLKYWTIGTTR